MEKGSDYRQWITSRRWVRLRHEVLSAHPLCQRCEAEGIVTAAAEVHHVRPVESGVSAGERERLMFSAGNLRALCHACHVRTHTEMGRSGKALTRQRTRAQVNEVISRFFGPDD